MRFLCSVAVAFLAIFDITSSHKLIELDTALLDQSPKPIMAKWTLFGDSITERASKSQFGWASLLSAKFARSVDILNRGFGGYNSRWGLYLLDEAISRGDDAFTKASLVTIFFGANDCVPNGSPQHVPLLEYRSNLVQIIETLRNNSLMEGLVALVLITPPPSRDKTRRLNDTAMYAQVVREIALDREIPLLDLWPPTVGINTPANSTHRNVVFETIIPERHHLLDDGLHLSAKGNLVLFEGLQKLIAAMGHASSKSKNPNMYYPAANQLSGKSPEEQRYLIQNWNYHKTQQ